MHRGELFGAGREQSRALTPLQMPGEGLQWITPVQDCSNPVTDVCM